MKKKNSRGITLIALIITIIILLILAGIAISNLTQSGLFGRAQEAKEKTENAHLEENTTLGEYEQWISNYIGEQEAGGSGASGDDGKNNEQQSSETKPATNIAGAQSNDMLTKTVNSEIEDEYGNKITIPAGFKIKTDENTNNALTVDKGIVIVDKNENEFVWIPVGKIYTDIDRTEENAKIITFNRYTFDSDGKTTLNNIDTVTEMETENTEYANTKAKDINSFKISVEHNSGYYIGRYEARTKTARSQADDTLNTITENGADYVYNYVTQPQAAELARNMYTSSNFTSDLINSYAWDTATLFIQICGTNSKYSRQKSLNTSFANKGTNNTETEDVQCNIYDMASNMYEWSTETYTTIDPCIDRGGYFGNNIVYTSYRRSASSSESEVYNGFRPILYVNQKIN